METVQQNGRSTLFSSKFLSIYSILYGNITQIDSSTIHGNVEFVHSQYTCILTSQVSIQFFCPTKLLIIVIVLEKVLILQ